MTSKIGMKTCARQKIIGHPSSIQFDHVLDDKGNKPCASKSKGTLHRWGMTSFTSLRNSQMNGRKEKAISTVTETKKRKTEQVEANDPFSFEFESNIKKKGGRKGDFLNQSQVETADSKASAPAPPKTNKFFKSGSSRASMFGSKSNLVNKPRPVTVLNPSNVMKQNVYFENLSAAPIVKNNPVVARDAFAELLLSAEVPGVSGVAPAEICLSAYPEESEVATNMFSTYSQPPVTTYNSTPSNLITHSFGYDQNFYHQHQSQDVNVIQNQVLFPVSTIPESVIQPEVIFPCPIIQQQPAQQLSSRQTQMQFPQNQMPVLQNNLSIGINANQPTVNVLDNGNLVDNINLPNLSSGSFSKAHYAGGSNEDDLFDTLRKSSSTYSCYPINTLSVPQVKPPEPVYTNSNALTKQVHVVEMKQNEILDNVNSNGSYLIASQEQQQQHPSLEIQRGPQIIAENNFNPAMVAIPETSISRKEDWSLNDHNQPMMEQPPVNTMCDNNIRLDQSTNILETKLHPENIHLPETLLTKPVKKDWGVFPSADSVEPSINLPSSSSLETTQACTKTNLPAVKSEPKSWELSYEPAAKPRLVSSLSFGGSSKSFFSQRRIFNSPKKMERKAVYKHRPWQAEEERDERPTESSSSIVDEFDDFESDSSPEKPSLHRVVTWPTTSSVENTESVTAVKCEKKFREYYTVVRNVKQAHQCHESGETQEYNDDVEYLLESLQDTNKIGTRCLSLLSLASKCMASAFRMHLRAHGALTKVFSALHDAPKQPNLALCTATVLFVLSQDRLNMDLERSSLDLMLQLLDTEGTMDSNRRDREFDKNKEKVVELCDELQKKGHAKHLDLDNVTVGVLAMESLLSLTSKRAGEWFKEELRELGGLEHLVNTVSECGKCLPPVLVQLTDYALDKLRKLDRCLRVLENVTVMNSENQYYLINCQNSSLIYYCSRALQLCETCLEAYPTPDSSDKESASWILFSCLLSTMKVLLNLTNENCNGSAKVGEQEGLINSLLSCVLYLPSHLTAEQRFDVLVLSLGLLINLVEYCENNRKRLFFAEVTPPNVSHHRRCNGSIPAPKALVNLFLEHEDAARVEEAKTDKLLDGKGDQDADSSNKDDSSAQNNVDDIEETLKKALQKAGKNMEDSMIAAYIALLLGCIVQNSKESASRIRDHLPNKSFDGMVTMLNKFLNFITLTDIVGSAGMKSIKHVIEILETS